MIAKIYSAVLEGLNPQIIEIETGLLGGLSSFHIVGLADKSIAESRERLTLALKSIKAKPPLKLNAKTIVNLAPGDIKKGGALLDLGIAMSFLLASEQISPTKIDPLDNVLFLGELGLDGNLKKVQGVLPIILTAVKLGFQKFFIPAENQSEIRFLKNAEIYVFKNLKEVVGFLENTEIKSAIQPREFKPEMQEVDLDFLKLPQHLWRALEVAAAGRHNLLLYGPPGTGKTLIGKTLTYLLPALNYQESLEVTRIYSACGELQDDFIFHPPFRHPHHSASPISILGGGSSPQPGEISLAHRGILFLDELPEFRRDVLEGLREPLENKEITIARVKRRIKFPANFLFIAAYNPCPCGFYQDKEKECVCSAADIRRYQKKISGPILDRLDIFLFVPRIEGGKIFKENKVDVGKIRQRIAKLKEIQLTRQGKYNGELTAKELKTYCQIDCSGEETLEKAADNFKLSLRAIHKILKTARTIADINEEKNIQENYISEAIQYRFWQNE
jgi:magnesium chelatase family protein